MTTREEREHKKALKRTTDNLRAWCATYPIAAQMQDSPGRDDVLAALDEYDREMFLNLEATTWPQAHTPSAETKEHLVEAVRLATALVKVLDTLSRELPGHRGHSALQARDRMQMVLGSVAHVAVMSGIDVEAAS